MDLVWPPPAQTSTSEPPPTSLPLPHAEAYEGEPREYARALMQRKDEIEKEIEALKDVLSSHGATGSTSLVDPEGYPRGDIDIYAIRHARSALVRLQNDRTTVTEHLSLALQNAFAVGSSSQPEANHINGIPMNSTSAARQTNGHTSSSTEWPERPIARVNSVAPGSPAAESGLKREDLIYSFGGVTVESLGGLQAIGTLVAASEGTSLQLLISRGEERVTLNLTPRNGWGGRGSLGCHILPV